ncbi:UbiA family prenyltransferase [Albibacterium indicum]|uniref:UbiA family prenyltransferase n=1 Tax=Albibacterium indicum TaxID=2292082 RepID=UPI000E5504FC|nr:UbiA family prenyltransferase [Pedobacter indicus]
MTLIRKIYRVFRLSEWWEYKIVPVLAIAYATCIQLDISIFSNISWILFLLVSIIVGAIYVSTINDITDMEDDLRCGKENRMAKIQPKYRFIAPLVCLLAGCFFAYQMSVDLISLILYILPWIVYSLYSFKPFRLKERGFWGVLADALGAHVFISLLIVSSLSFKNNALIDWTWFTLVGGWSLTFGIRGILWHQFHDRENDLESGTRTFATARKPDEIKRIEFVLLFLELPLFIGMSFKIQPMLILPILLLYFLFVLLRHKCLGYKPVIIINPKNSPLQILMIDFYLVFFPLGLLVFSGFNHGNFWILLGHLFLFNSKLRKVILDSYHILVSNKRYFMSSP